MFGSAHLAYCGGFSSPFLADRVLSLSELVALRFKNDIIGVFQRRGET
jgi:hypothetical protein